MRILGLLVVLSLLPAGPGSPGRAEIARSALAGLDDFVVREMGREGIPGLALAVVRDGRIIYLKGYGQRDLAARLPVTPRTVFNIGSVSKSFCAASLGVLAARGRLEWDRPVRDILPGFQVSDPPATAQLTLRDLVTHRSGLGIDRLLWAVARRENPGRKEIVEALRHIPARGGFRAGYRYGNPAYLVAGWVAEQVEQVAWEDLIRRDLFVPLGMNSSSARRTDLLASAEPARPYVEGTDGKPVPVDCEDYAGMVPALGINASAEDLARYLLVLMNEGRLDGRPVLDAALVREMQTPQVVIPGGQDYPELGRACYGLGLYVGTYRGHPQVYHGGSSYGYVSNLAWLPEEQLGVVVLTNYLSANRGVPVAITYRIFDRFLGLPEVEWGDRYAAKAEGNRASLIVGVKNVQPRRGSEAAEWVRHLPDCTGTYAHPVSAYGSIRVAAADGRLGLIYRGEQIPLDPLGFGLFYAAPDKIRMREDIRVRFQVGFDGRVEKLAIRIGPRMEPVEFVRQHP